MALVFGVCSLVFSFLGGSFCFWGLVFSLVHGVQLVSFRLGFRVRVLGSE